LLIESQEFNSFTSVTSVVTSVVTKAVIRQNRKEHEGRLFQLLPFEFEWTWLEFIPEKSKLNVVTHQNKKGMLCGQHLY